jgi:hypothetical protein
MAGDPGVGLHRVHPHWQLDPGRVSRCSPGWLPTATRLGNATAGLTRLLVRERFWHGRGGVRGAGAIPAWGAQGRDP